MLRAGLPVRTVGLSRHESMMVGAGISGRGAVDFIVAGITLEAGLFQQHSPTPQVVQALYSSIESMALVTTVATPLFLHWLIRIKKSS